MLTKAKGFAALGSNCVISDTQQELKRTRFPVTMILVGSRILAGQEKGLSEKVLRDFKDLNLLAGQSRLVYGP